VDLEAKANFKSLGPRLGKNMKSVAESIAKLSHQAISDILDGGTLVIDDHTIDEGDIVVVRRPREGTVVATAGAVSVALDTTLDRALIVEGMAREIINRIQAERRALDFEVSDRIRVRWTSASDEVVAAFDAHGDLIAGEVLAVDISYADSSDGALIDLAGKPVQLEITISR